jgi:hypothetical protein
VRLAAAKDHRPMNVPSCHVLHGSPLLVLVLNSRRLMRAGRQRGMTSTPSLDTGLLIGAEHELVRPKRLPCQRQAYRSSTGRPAPQSADRAERSSTGSARVGARHALTSARCCCVTDRHQCRAVPRSTTEPARAEALGLTTTTYRLAQLRYDLAKLRAKGLVLKVPGTQRTGCRLKASASPCCSSSSSTVSTPH